MKLAQG